MSDETSTTIETTDQRPADTTQTTTTTTDPAAFQAAIDALKAANDGQIGELKAIIAAQGDAIRAALTPRTPTNADGTMPLDPRMRQLIRQGGLTDKEIDANWPVVAPFLAAFVATDGAIILNEVGSVREDVAMLRASKNTKDYPDWEAVEGRVGELREDAQKNGRSLSVKDAYRAAVAMDIEKVSEARSTRRTRTSNAADVSAQQVTDHGRRAGTGQGDRRSAMTADDIANMSREDRKKYFDGVGNLPIR